MKTTAIIYSFNTVKTAKIAKKIKDEFGNEEVDMINAEDITGDQFMEYEQLILGVPTWFDGELPNYWDELIPDIEDRDLKGKKIAVFGLGDQKKYSENFVDGIGIMARLLRERNAEIVGYTSIKGYHFEFSQGQEGDRFMGLAIDYENQGSKNKERVAAWVDLLKKEFK